MGRQTTTFPGVNPSSVDRAPTHGKAPEGTPDASGAAAAPGASGSPCQYRHNCRNPFEDVDEKEVGELLAKARKVGGSHRKTAYALAENVGGIVRHAGVSNCVFFTPTLANDEYGQPPTPDRAQNCWRLLQLRIAEEFPGGGVRIMERGGRTLRLHYHVLLDVEIDVRIGYDFEASRAIQAANPRAKWELHESANPQLRAIHNRLKLLARQAGFGVIFHCEPVRSESEAIKTYLAKYICKHVGQRLLIDKKRRLVAYFGRWSEPGNREIPAAGGFAFGGSLTQVVRGVRRPDFRNAWAWLWRAKLGQWMRKQRIPDLETATEVLGSHWAYRCAEQIRAEVLKRYPYFFLAVMDQGADLADIPLDAQLTPDFEVGASVPVLRSKRSRVGGVVSYAGADYDSEDVMAKYQPQMPQVSPGEFTVIWSDGSFDRSELSICEV